MFAPILPFVTEEVWSWWHDGSVHRAAWPTAGDVPIDGDPDLLAAAASVLSGIRGVKSARSLSMRAGLGRVTVRGQQSRLDLVAAARDDLSAAGRVGELALVPDRGAAELTVEA
jgi:valyl-tRNA synthetase